MIITMGLMFLTTPLMLIIFSYVRISWAVFGISSPGGRWKAFSTCGSHLTVVLLFYGSLMGVYLLPPSTHSAEREKRAAILYMVIIPMLNPFIYSLRNRDMKEALGKLWGGRKTFFLPWQWCLILVFWSTPVLHHFNNSTTLRLTLRKGYQVTLS